MSELTFKNGRQLKKIMQDQLNKAIKFNEMHKTKFKNDLLNVVKNRARNDAPRGANGNLKASAFSRILMFTPDILRGVIGFDRYYGRYPNDGTGRRVGHGHHYMSARAVEGPLAQWVRIKILKGGGKYTKTEKIKTRLKYNKNNITRRSNRITRRTGRKDIAVQIAWAIYKGSIYPYGLRPQKFFDKTIEKNANFIRQEILKILRMNVKRNFGK